MPGSATTIAPAAGRCSSSSGEDACTQAMVRAERPGETARDIRGADSGTRVQEQARAA